MDAVLLALVTVRMVRRFPISPSEGWDLAHQAVAATGHSIYASPGILAPVNYPPLFFYLTAAIPLGGDSLLSGRIADWLAAVACCVLVGLLSAQLGCRRLIAWLAALVAGLLLLTAGQNYVGMDNPHLTASALSLCGLWLYLRLDCRRVGPALSVALFCALGFAMKQTALAVPAGIAIDALFAGRKKAVPVLITLAAGFVALAGVCYALFGNDFVQQMTLGRVYHLADLRHFNQVMATLATWLTLAALQRSGGWPKARAAALVLACAWLLALAGEGGEGTDVNLWFDTYLATSICLALVLEAWLGSWPVRPGARVAFLAALGCLLAISSYRYPGDLWPGTFVSESDRFGREVAFLKMYQGPVWCEDLFLCHEAGLPLEQDTFWVNQMILTGQLEPQPLKSTIAAGRFRVFQFNSPWPPAGDAHGLPADVMDAIEARYQVVYNDGNAVFLTP